MNYNNLSDGWWAKCACNAGPNGCVWCGTGHGDVTCLIALLPQELIDLISSFITSRSRHIAHIFKQEVLAQQKTFTLFAIETQDTYNSYNSYAVDIQGSGWNIPFNDRWFCGSQATTPLKYHSGTPVPLWWIRHLSPDWCSPFYKLTSRFFHCSPSCWDNGVGSCKNIPSHPECRCTWIDDDVWGHGPQPNTYPPIMNNGDEVTYRKNLPSMATSTYCLDTRKPTHPFNQDWKDHQIQNPTLDCPLCKQVLKEVFGKNAFKYSAKCVYTRPRTNHQYIEHLGWTNRPPQLKKHLPSQQRQLRRKLRKKKKKKKNTNHSNPNRRISKLPIS